MAETLRSLSLSVVSDTDSSNFSGLGEEFSNTVLFSSEAHVSTEDSVRFTSLAGSRTTGTGFVTRELDIDVSSINFSTVGGSLSLSSILMGLVLNECNTLSV